MTSQEHEEIEKMVRTHQLSTIALSKQHHLAELADWEFCKAIDEQKIKHTKEIKQLLLSAEKRVLIREAKWFHQEIYKISQELDIGEKDNPLIPECVVTAYENIKARLREYGITKEQLKSGGG